MHTPKHGCRQAPELMRNIKEIKKQGKKNRKKEGKEKTHLELSMNAF